MLLLLMLIAAVTLIVLGITRAAHRDGKRGLICIAFGAILLIVFVIHARQFAAAVKSRAREYKLTHPKTVRIPVKSATQSGHFGHPLGA